MEGRICETRVEEVNTRINYLIPHLPDAIWLEILEKLPVKSIFRFKCVSRGFLSLISDPCFPQFYTRQQNNTLQTQSPPWTLLMQYMDDKEGNIPPDQMRLHPLPPPQYTSSGFTLPFLDPFVEFSNMIVPPLSPVLQVLAADNGLLLCCATRVYQTYYYVCNPLTMKWVALPKTPQVHEWVSVGLVVDPITGRYHVVRIVSLGLKTELDLEIFSSSAGEWRESKVSCPFPVPVRSWDYRAVTYKGVIHWCHGSKKVIAYDPEKDTDSCRLIHLPKCQGVLGVSQGQLCYLFMKRFHIPSLSVWVLRNYESGEWCLEHRTQLRKIGSTNSSLRKELRAAPIYTLMPLAFHPLNSNIVFLNYKDQLSVYDFRSRRCHVTCSDMNDRALLPPWALWPWTVTPFVLPPWPTPVPQPSWNTPV